MKLLVLISFFVTLFFSNAIPSSKRSVIYNGSGQYHARGGVVFKKRSGSGNPAIAQFLAKVFGALGKKKGSSSPSPSVQTNVRPVVQTAKSNHAVGISAGANRTNEGVKKGALGNWGALSMPGRAAFMASARTYEGTPYVWGAEGPRVFDCTGYITDILQKKGCLSNSIRLTSANIPSHLRRASSCKPGDIVRRPGHAAFYVEPGRVYGAVGGSVDRVTEHSYTGTCYQNPCLI